MEKPRRLTVDSTLARRLRVASMLLLAVFLVIPFAVQFGFNAQRVPLLLPLLAISLTAASAALVVAYLAVLAPVSRVLCIDSNQLIYERSNGRVVASATLDRVFTDGASLLLGRHLVPMRYVAREAFGVEQREALLRVLPARNRISPLQLYWKALKAGNLGVMLAILFVLVAIAIRYLAG